MRTLHWLGLNMTVFAFMVQNIYHQYMLLAMAFFLRKGLIQRQQFGEIENNSFVRSLQRLFFALGWVIALTAVWHIASGGGTVIGGVLILLGLLIAGLSKTVWQWGHGMDRVKWIFSIAKTCDADLVEPILKASFAEGEGIVPHVIGTMPRGVLNDIDKDLLASLLSNQNRDIRIAALKRIWRAGR